MHIWKFELNVYIWVKHGKNFKCLHGLVSITSTIDIKPNEGAYLIDGEGITDSGVDCFDI